MSEEVLDDGKMAIGHGYVKGFPAEGVICVQFGFVGEEKIDYISVTTTRGVV